MNKLLTKLKGSHLLCQAVGYHFALNVDALTLQCKQLIKIYFM